MPAKARAGLPRDRLVGWHSGARTSVSRDFFPFDLLAAAYLLHPELFRCAQVAASIEPHSWFWRWRLGASGLFVDQSPEEAVDGPRHRIVYCSSPTARLHDAALADLTRARPASMPR
jgi:hypothetical protein